MMKKIKPFSYKSLSIIIILLLSGKIHAQDKTIIYTATSADIANPERGWYDQYTTHSGGSSLGTTYNSLNAADLLSKRGEQHMTLILRMFMLHEFLETDTVSKEYIAKVQADFDAIRYAGMKAIVRFAYSRSQSAAVWDASPEKVFSHIQSLGDVLMQNSDVIAAVQAGFIGAWGEWYYTKNFAGQGYVPDEADKQNRITLVENLLNVLPENIVVEARTPAQMQYLTKTEDPISGEEAYNGSFKARIGHHNDCFVASASDYGTYTNLDADLAYLHESTKYTITGGETCDGSNSYSDCVNSTERMELLHWTYMNRGYNQAVYDKWEEQGCYDEASISLGYRLELTSAVIPEQVDPGGTLDLTLNLNNTGYAAPTQYKPVQLVLRNTTTLEATTLDLAGSNDDIRFWMPGEITFTAKAEIPADLAEGNYTLSLRIPDKNEMLSENPAYSIQFANAGTWNPDYGTNRLNHILSIGQGGEGALPLAPEDLEAKTISYTQIDLSWTDNSDDETGFEIMRAQGEGIAWKHIATLDPDTEFFSDPDLMKGTYYHYIIRSINEYGFSEWSDSATTATLGVYVDNEKRMAVSVFPNPLTNGTLSIQFPDNTRKHIIVHQISGAEVLNTITDNQQFQIDYEKFIPGLYILSLSHNGTVENKKLLVF